MSPVTDVLDVALQLSKGERAKVAEALLDSLDDAPIEPIDSIELELEVERRLEAFRLGRTTADDWRVVIGRVKAELESRRQ